MNAYSVLAGGQARGGIGALGQTITHSDITNEFAHRGYVEQAPQVVHHVVTIHEPPPALTRRQAIVIAVDEGINAGQLPRTSSHPYRCPTGTCPVQPNLWENVINWTVSVANGYMSGQYSIPAWAQNIIHTGALGSLGGHLGGWLQENEWVIKSVGDIIQNYGEFLTAKNVEDAIKQVEQNTRGTLTKEDALALVARLQQGGFIQAGQTGTAAEGALAAAQPSWMMPALFVGGAVILYLMISKR